MNVLQYDWKTSDATNAHGFIVKPILSSLPGKVNGVRLKAPVKAGREQEVKVLHMAKASDQPWPRVMRRLLAREAAKR